MSSAASAMKFPDAVHRSQGWLRRFMFRWLALYLLLYNSDGMLMLLPGLKWVGHLWDQLGEVVVLWVGKHLLHLSQQIATDTCWTRPR